jgi:hypothetical protein
MTLDTVVDNLRDGYAQLEKGSFLHVDQFQELLPTDLFLQKMMYRSFHTADGYGYFLREDGDINWVITREDQNLVLRHLDDEVNNSYDQLSSEENFFPDNSEAETAKKAEGTVVVKMSGLRLSIPKYVYGKKVMLLRIRTTDGFVKVDDTYQPPTEEERKAIQRLVYNAKVPETKIYVPDPDYVTEQLTDSGYNSLWQASWLAFHKNIHFELDAANHLVYFRSSLRGMRRTT